MFVSFIVLLKHWKGSRERIWITGKTQTVNQTVFTTE